MDFPHRRTPDTHTLDQHLAATIRLDETRPQIISLPELPLRHRSAVSHHLDKFVTSLVLLRCAVLPAIFLLALPRPPVRFIRLPIENALASDGDVRCFI